MDFGGAGHLRGVRTWRKALTTAALGLVPLLFSACDTEPMGPALEISPMGSIRSSASGAPLTLEPGDSVRLTVGEEMQLGLVSPRLPSHGAALPLSPAVRDARIEVERSGPWILVRVFSSADLAATGLNRSEVTFGTTGSRAGVATRADGSYMFKTGDYDGDGLRDILLYFDSRMLSGASGEQPPLGAMYLLGMHPEGGTVRGGAAGGEQGPAPEPRVWSSLDASIATVSGSGHLYAVGVGATHLTYGNALGADTIVVVVAALPVLPSGPYTYYVSAEGSDFNPGTSGSAAWRTIEKVNSWRFEPGDRVLFRGGDTFEGQLRFTAEDAGAAGLPVTVGSYGSGRATIMASTGHALLVYNAGYFVIRSLNLTSPDRLSNQGSGVLFYNDLPGNTKLSHIRIDSVSANGFGEHGIAIVGHPADGSKSGYADVRITHSEAFDNAHTGIRTSGFWSTTSPDYAHSNVYVGHSRAYDNPGVPGYGNHSGSGIFLEDVDGGMIEYSVAHHNGSLSNYAGGGPVGIWAAVANEITIQYNESHSNRSRTVDGGGFDFDGGTTNSVMQYNYSHDNDGAGYLVWNYRGAPHTNANLTIRYNISQNDGRNARNGAIQTGGSATGPILIHNNSVYLSRTPRGTAKGFVNAGSNHTKFWNNILVGSGGVRLVQAVARPGSELRGNNYWAVDGDLRMVWAGTVYDSYAAWRAASGQEMLDGADTGHNVDPRLRAAGAGPALGDAKLLGTLAAYGLEARSPMIGAGLDLRRLGVDPGRVDFFGVPLPVGSPLGIGAAESAPMAGYGQ